MRVTGGYLAGRSIACPPGVIRPAMDRMRESIFGILGPLEGATFLDLFSGSGVIAIEAISRGATGVTLVERDRGKRPVILKNLELTDGSPTLFISPVERFIERTRDSYDYVFLDPPFDYRFKADVIERVARRGVVNPGGTLIIHYPSSDVLPEVAGDLSMTDQRKYGRSMVRFYTRAQVPPVR